MKHLHYSFIIMVALFTLTCEKPEENNNSLPEYDHYFAFYNNDWLSIIKEGELFEKQIIELNDFRGVKFSPDSKRLIYIGNSRHLFSIDTSGSSNHEIVSNRSVERFDISQDGNDIVYQSDGHVYTVNVVGNNEMPSLEGVNPYFAKGDEILFHRTIVDQALHYVILSYDMNTGVETLISDSTYSSEIVGMSKDKSLVLIKSWIVRVPNSTKFDLLSSTGEVTELEYEQLNSESTSAYLSPSGSYILYSVYKENGLKDIFQISIEDKSDELIKEDVRINHYPYMSSDSRHMIYMSNRYGNLALYTTNIESLEESFICDLGSSSFAISPYNW